MQQEHRFLTTGRNLGFFTGYIAFTTILYMVLSLLHRLPPGWTFLHIMAATLVITSAGVLLRRVL
jgi:hypothetical protein